MSLSLEQLPDDVDTLKILVVAKDARVEQVEQLLRIRDEVIRLMRLEKYGAKSEKLSDRQLSLLDEEPGVHAQEVEKEAEEPAPAPRPRKKPRNPKPGRMELPAHLPRVEKIISCPPEQCHCGQCQREKSVIGYETSEVLSVKPAEYFVEVLKREKRACHDCPEEGVECAPTPARIVEKSQLSDELIVDVMLKKHRDHLPLYRQSDRLLTDARLDIDRSVLCHNMMKAGELCAALAGAVKEDLLEGGYIQADESPVGVQDPTVKGRNHRAYMWEYSRPHGPVVFDFQMGRSREGPARFLKDFGGILQCDGYGAYDKLNDKQIIYVGCMAHARRNFDKALKVSPEDPVARDILRKFREIYAVEKRARIAGLDPDQRRELRQRESRPLMETLKKQVLETRQRTLPASLLAKACDYCLGQWERIVRFLDFGQVEVDNNWCENAIRPLALGRKNWLHIGSEEAGAKIAGILSILETCRRLEINPRDYLLDVLPGLNDKPQSELVRLTPMAWKTRQKAA